MRRSPSSCFAPRRRGRRPRRDARLPGASRSVASRRRRARATTFSPATPSRCAPRRAATVAGVGLRERRDARRTRPPDGAATQHRARANRPARLHPGSARHRRWGARAGDARGRDRVRAGGSRRPSGDGKVALAGVSIGATLALLVAADPMVAANGRQLPASRPYTDLAKVMLLATTGQVPSRRRDVVPMRCRRTSRSDSRDRTRRCSPTTAATAALYNGAAPDRPGLGGRAQFREDGLSALPVTRR